MEHVGVGRRAVAFIMDVVLLFIVAWAIALLTGGTTSTGFELRGIPFLLTVIVWIAYFAVMEKTMGATLGKMAMGLRVVRPDGCPISWSSAIVRNLLRIVDGLFFYLVGAILVWQSPTRQRLGDRAGGTMVVRAHDLPTPEACHATANA
jgi:uncharacterized RDD family membrane protein YckC